MNALVAFAVLAVLAVAQAAIASDETTFDSGPELGQRLLQNVVKIESRDLAEHGFGLVVGVDQRHAYIATARHVVARRPPAGLDGPERASGEIAVGFCALQAAPPQSAEILGAFDGAADDLALLRTALPSGYAAQRRALAPVERNALGEQVWLVGREQECALVPTAGVIGALPDTRHNLRIDLHGALGGSSGAPVLSGYGIVGVTKRSDNETIRVHAIADLQARVQALAGTPFVPFVLGPAHNIPPGDPQAAVIDLTETLNAYLFGVRDIHALLKQDIVPRPTFARLVDSYSRSVDRFKAARDKYDGTLKANWPEDVLPEWSALRERLWKIHLVFFRLNGESATAITRTEHSPPAVRAQMAALEPELVALESDIAGFASKLGKRRTDHASPSR
jgi:hypothetical protein